MAGEHATARWAAEAARAGQLQDLAFWDLHVLGAGPVPSPIATCLAPAARDFVAAVLTPTTTTFQTQWVAPGAARKEGLVMLGHYSARTHQRALVLTFGDGIVVPTIGTANEVPIATRVVAVGGKPAAIAAALSLFVSTPVAAPAAVVIVY